MTRPFCKMCLKVLTLCACRPSAKKKAAAKDVIVLAKVSKQTLITYLCDCPVRTLKRTGRTIVYCNCE